MAQTTTTPMTSTTSKTATEGTSLTVSATETPVVIERPVVYERKRSKGRRKKKKHSRGWKEPQQLEEDASRAVNRLANSVADGIGKYRERRDNSARKKRDGAIKDALRNTGRGLTKALDKAARAPSDLTRRATSKRISRVFIVPPPFSYFMRGR
jgi:hypothetical protein